MTKSPLHGCIPILCTPFFDDGSIDFEGLGREIEYVLGEGASGVATLAIASEGYKLTEWERDAVAECVVKTVAGRAPVVMSADGAGTEVAIDRARRAAARGADVLMVLPPYFVKPDPAALFDYYTRIGQSVEIPLMIQDAPQLTGVTMGPALWSRLNAETPSIRYVKIEGTPQGAAISETITQSEGKLAVFCGWGGLGLIDALERGSAGSMPAANMTRLFAETQSRFESGDVAGATARFERALPFLVWSMQSVDFNVAAAKEAFRRLGIFSCAARRQPFAPLDGMSRDQLDRWLERFEEISR